MDQPTQQLVSLSRAVYNLGYFADGYDLCREIANRGETSKVQRALWFLNAVNYMGYTCGPESPLFDPNPAANFRIEAFDDDGTPSIAFHGGSAGINSPQSAAAVFRSLLFEDVRSEYPVESLFLSLADAKVSNQQKTIEVEQMRKRLADSLWIVPSDHPTAALNVAQWCVDHHTHLEFARSLVNCCLGWRYPLRRIDDLIVLARLLNYFKAPRVFWTSLLGRYVDFACDDSLNQAMVLRAGISSALVELRRATVNAKEGTFHRFCADHGLPNHDGLLRVLLGSLDFEVDENANRFMGTDDYTSRSYDEWLTVEAVQMRHPWFAMLMSHERDFVRNADTAFAACVTRDFSFGCAQWWRCVESVLRRRLIAPLGDLVDANPAWVAEDQIYASRRSDEWDWESIFVRILPDARRRKQLSLTQMLILLEKCIADYAKQRQSKSTVRRNCVEYIGSKLPEFRWVKGELDEVADFRSAMTPRVLNEETIASFRNAASHDQPMDYEHAVVGRLLAIRILDFMHYPRYCTHENLEQLKLELADINAVEES